MVRNKRVLGQKCPKTTYIPNALRVKTNTLLRDLITTST